jgi:hypothetical protein
MTRADDANVIFAYTLDQAIEDGVLVEIFKHRWGQLSGGKPIGSSSLLVSQPPHPNACQGCSL